ncbi:MAG: hypothetical protein RL419_433 [Actinomycetota bacterium]
MHDYRVNNGVGCVFVSDLKFGKLHNFTTEQDVDALRR